MINVNELRIGNLIEYNNRFWEVGSITAFPTIGIANNDEESLLNDEMATPIMLTPDVLEKCGFVIINHIEGYSFYSFKRKPGSTMPALSIYGYKTELNGYGIKHLKSLHELQNLYFSLTGKEIMVQYFLSERKR